MSKLKEGQVIILASDAGAIKNAHKGFFELDKEKLNNPTLENVTKYLSASLNSIIEDGYGIAINHSLILFAAENSQKNYFIVFYVDAPDRKKEKQEIIKKSRALALFIIQQLLPNDDLFYQKPDLSWLQKDSLQILEERRSMFLSNKKNAKVLDTFSLIDSIKSEPLLSIDSDFITLDDESKKTDFIEGAGIPDGFSNNKSWIELHVTEESMKETGDIRHFTVTHPNHLKIFIEACSQEIPVRFGANKITQKMKQKPSYTLTHIEIDNTPNDTDSYELIS
ncbi:MAG: hypothetical protein LC677_14020 [Halomonas sp.]|nr:hypothetical protein [Halomonas sp.]